MAWTDFVDWLDENKVVLIAVTCTGKSALSCLYSETQVKLIQFGAIMRICDRKKLYALMS